MHLEQLLLQGTNGALSVLHGCNARPASLLPSTTNCHVYFVCKWTLQTLDDAARNAGHSLAVQWRLQSCC